MGEPELRFNSESFFSMCWDCDHVFQLNLCTMVRNSCGNLKLNLSKLYLNYNLLRKKGRRQSFHIFNDTQQIRSGAVFWLSGKRSGLFIPTVFVICFESSSEFNVIQLLHWDIIYICSFVCFEFNVSKIIPVLQGIFIVWDGKYVLHVQVWDLVAYQCKQDCWDKAELRWSESNLIPLGTSSAILKEPCLILAKKTCKRCVNS